MATRYERMKDSEKHNGVLITNLATALMDTAQLDMRSDTEWNLALLCARDFMMRVRAEVPMPAAADTWEF